MLFDSGKTDIKGSGQDALRQVATVLKTISDRHFQVAGDTDNVPIQTALFPSNWELSTRRAVEVVHFLVAQGMRPQLLSAAGYGEFDPISPNDWPTGARRIVASESRSSRTSTSLSRCRRGFNDPGALRRRFGGERRP